MRVVLLQVLDYMRLRAVKQRPIGSAKRSLNIAVFQMIEKLLHCICYLRRPAKASTSQILEDAPHRVGVERFAALRVLVPDVGQGDVCDSIVKDKARAHKAQESAESDVGTLGNLEI